MVVVIIQNQGIEKKVLNIICRFCWVSLLKLGLGVTTTRFPEIEDIDLSIRVRVRFNISLLP